MTRCDKSHITINEGGRFFTLYARWSANAVAPKFFRIYLFGWVYCTLKGASKCRK